MEAQLRCFHRVSRPLSTRENASSVIPRVSWETGRCSRHLVSVASACLNVAPELEPSAEPTPALRPPPTWRLSAIALASELREQARGSTRRSAFGGTGGVVIKTCGCIYHVYILEITRGAPVEYKSSL